MDKYLQDPDCWSVDKDMGVIDFESREKAILFLHNLHLLNYQSLQALQN